MKAGFLDKLIERIDRIDTSSLQTHFLRLAHEKGLLETIFNAIHEGVLVLNEKGAVGYANRAAQRMLGFRLGAIEGKPIGSLLQDVDWDLLMNFDEQEWSRLVTRELEITYPEHRYIEFYVVPLQVVNEEDKGAVIILRDVTREREQTASTLESERLNAIMLLSAGVAHEIGNPLNSLNIHLQLLGRELSDLSDDAARASLQELVGVAGKEVERLDQIIHQFLRAIRPSEPQRESVPLEALIRDTLKLMSAEIEDRGIWVEPDFQEDLAPIRVDKGQMQQAVYNLVKNGIQAMGEGGVLKIRLRGNDQAVEMAFTDNGVGITPEDLSNIYEPFHTTKSEGSGLGLMIVQRIMRDHGGQIEIETRPGRGTTITLVLPRQDNRIRLLENAAEPAPEPPPHD